MPLSPHQKTRTGRYKRTHVLVKSPHLPAHEVLSAAYAEGQFLPFNQPAMWVCLLLSYTSTGVFVPCQSLPPHRCQVHVKHACIEPPRTTPPKIQTMATAALRLGQRVVGCQRTTVPQPQTTIPKACHNAPATQSHLTDMLLHIHACKNPTRT